MPKENTKVKDGQKDNARRTWIGIVVSDKNDKTIVVSVQSTKSHPIYKKKYHISKKFHVHDENNSHKVGQTVRFIETKPISKTKHYKVI